MTDDGEEWRDIPGWPGYEVSSLGRVRSVPRVLPTGQVHGGTVLRQTRDRKGYRRVKLRDGTQVRVVRVHVLVAEAFLPPRPPGKVIRHRNDDHSDNSAQALSYGTLRQNVWDRTRRQRRERKIEQKRERSETDEIEGVAYRALPAMAPVAPGGDLR